MFLKLPEISKSSEKVIITDWHVAVGERVEKGKDLLEVSTDKATFDIASPCDGVLSGIMKYPGETAEKEDVLAEITVTER